MIQTKTGLLAEAEAYVQQIFEERISSDYVYHDFPHTREVVEAAIEIGLQYNLNEREMRNLQLAGWFHDVGYYGGAEGHEERSCELATAFLQERSYPEEDAAVVMGCIRATQLPQKPDSLLESILCDADLHHLGNEMYWDRCGRVRQELLQTKGIIMSEQEWVDFELGFMMRHQYHSEVARELYSKRKRKHVKQLKKQKLRLHPEAIEAMEEAMGEGKKKKKKKKKSKKTEIELKEINLGRGVETMYRTTYRTHVNLSSIADSKANFMLTINAVVISFVLTNLIPKLRGETWLIAPTVALLGTCLSALVFAILATRPKVTEGKVTREDIDQKKSNLLFFGNFYKMELEDFHWGMTEMIKDSDYLYSSMTRDLYFLGVVLAKKYRFLRICYGIFMYGLILSVLAFAIAYSFSPTH
ncbi:MAG: HD family phosphohydrolase [Phaeodactylibacter sp.]|nr:HD family phosphohydrolase [Phaeodactylibacter sp.]MCB9302044.1 HD family phosphohydrolase [Lewinellaceae bacterium]